MSRLHILFTLATPLLAPQRENLWVLDRWLAGAAALERFPLTMTQRHPHLPDWMDTTDLAIPLALDAVSGVYQTTQARFPDGGRLRYEHRTKKAIIEVAVRSGFVGSGIFKASHMRQPVWDIPRLAFVADVTDRDRLDTLLDVLYSNGVGGDRTRGYGMVSAIDARPLTDAESLAFSASSCIWDAQGEPTRPIPWSAVPVDYQESCHQGLQSGTLRLIHQRIVPPAWATMRQVLCLAPSSDWPTQLLTTLENSHSALQEVQ